MSRALPIYFVSDILNNLSNNRKDYCFSDYQLKIIIEEAQRRNISFIYKRIVENHNVYIELIPVYFRDKQIRGISFKDSLNFSYYTKDFVSKKTSSEVYFYAHKQDILEKYQKSKEANPKGLDICMCPEVQNIYNTKLGKHNYSFWFKIGQKLGEIDE